MFVTLTYGNLPLVATSPQSPRPRSLRPLTLAGHTSTFDCRFKESKGKFGDKHSGLLSLNLGSAYIKFHDRKRRIEWGQVRGGPGGGLGAGVGFGAGEEVAVGVALRLRRG